MHTELNYGREKLSLELPDDLEVTVIRKRAMPVLADPVAAIRKALQDPVAAPPLTQAAFHNARFMADPGAINCNFDRNPLHEEQLEIVRMLGGALALNTVVDEERRLAFVNFGEIIASHLEAVGFVREYSEVPIARKFKTVVTSAAGYPLDSTYYQTVKAMVGPIDILEPGGRLIVASECSEGLGSDEFIESQRGLIASGPKEFLRQILLKSHAAIDEWQTQMQLKPMAIGTLQLYSTGLTPAQHSLTGVASIDSVRSAILDSASKSGDPAVAIIPEGPYVVPFCASPQKSRPGSQQRAH